MSSENETNTITEAENTQAGEMQLELTDDVLDSLGLIKREDVEKIASNRDLKIQLITQAKEILYSNIQMHWEINKEYKKLPDAKEIVDCASILYDFVTQIDD